MCLLEAGVNPYSADSEGRCHGCFDGSFFLFLFFVIVMVYGVEQLQILPQPL
jgi:hypothetical protein